MNSIRTALLRIKPCIVQIFVTASLNGQPLQAIAGTGFFVSGQQYVATAAHVLTGTEKSLISEGATEIEFWVNVLVEDIEEPTIKFRGCFMRSPVSVVELNGEEDLAVLTTAHRLGKKGLTVKFGDGAKDIGLVDVSDVHFSTAKLEIGEEIVVAGFPLSLPYLVVQRGIVSALPILPVTGAINEREEILMDAQINPGNSGGPVFLASSGSVISVCRAQRLAPVLEDGTAHQKLMQSAGLGIATPSKLLMTMLEKHKIQYKVK